MSKHPKKRAWVQFHLSTAVVLMFVAGGLLWLNMPETATPEKVTAATTAARTSSESVAFEGWGQGWPLRWQSTEHFLFDSARGEAMRSLRAYWKLAVDIGAAMTILSLVAVVLEWRIRRKERRP
jgi:hypothetical protein